MGRSAVAVVAKRSLHTLREEATGDPTFTGIR